MSVLSTRMFDLVLDEHEVIYNFLENDSETGIYFTEEDVKKVGSPVVFFATILQNGSLLRAYNDLLRNKLGHDYLNMLLSNLPFEFNNNGRIRTSLEEIITSMQIYGNDIYFGYAENPRYSLIKSNRMKLKTDPATLAKTMYNTYTWLMPSNGAAGAGGVGGRRKTRKHKRKVI